MCLLGDDVAGPAFMEAFIHVRMTFQPRARNLRPMRSDHNIASRAERLANGLVQSVNVVLAVTGCVALGVLVGTHADPLQLAALAVYGAGLLAMVGASALYAWGRGGRHHTLYRHLDHAAIFLMIAGTYTPFTLISFDGIHGRWLLALIWAIALVGVLLKLIAPRRVEPLAIPLYLIMGWAVLSDPGLLLGLPASVVMLLVTGGVFYSAGIIFHLARVRYQEAIWHSFVLVAAVCHYAAVVRLVA
jgi:hemolysin III